MDAHKLWMLRDFIGTNKVYSKYRYIKGTMIGLSRIAIGCWRISMILSIVERNIFLARLSSWLQKMVDLRCKNIS